MQLVKYQHLHVGIAFLYWAKTMQLILQGAWDGITSQILVVIAETMCA